MCAWGIKSNLSKKLLEKTPEMKWWMPSYLGGSFQHDAIDSVPTCSLYFIFWIFMYCIFPIFRKELRTCSQRMISFLLGSWCCKILQDVKMWFSQTMANHTATESHVRICVGYEKKSRHDYNSWIPTAIRFTTNHCEDVFQCFNRLTSRQSSVALAFYFCNSLAAWWQE